MDVKWIKLSTDIFNNRKIRLIESMPDGASIVLLWLKILCVAGELNDNGLVYITREIPYTEELISAQFGVPIMVVKSGIELFKSLGMIEVIDNVLSVSNWAKYQNVDGMDKIREQTRERVARHRSQRQICGNVTCNVTVTQCNATDKNRIDKDIDNNIYNNMRNDADCVTQNDADCVTQSEPNCATQKYDDAFEEVWSVYPRKKDKGRGYNAYVARIRSGWRPEVLYDAAVNYAEETRKERTPEKYIKLASTFFGASTPFSDYIKSEKEDSVYDEENPFG